MKLHRFAFLVLCMSATVVGTRSAHSDPMERGNTPAPAPENKLTKPPRLIEFVEAIISNETEIPEEGISTNLEMDIAADGSVSDARVLAGAGEPWDGSALAAARRFRFEPAEIDGRPAPVQISYRYDFKRKAAAVAEAPKTAKFQGVIRNRKGNAPLPGVLVELDTGATVSTDSEGRFTFLDVPPGTHSVTLSGSSLTPTGTEESMAAGQTYDALYELELAEAQVVVDKDSDFELVVRAPRMSKQVVATSVSSEQGAKVAGTGGDVVKVVENLPGVARSSVGSGALVVWGAASEDTRVYVDGVHIPVLYHEGGFRSVVHSDLVKSVELQPGGYGANYGRGLGGLVTVGLKPLEADGIHGSLSADMIDSAASLRGNLGKKLRYAVAGRKSYLDWLLPKVSSADVGEFMPIPRYWDGQGRISWVPRDGETIELGALLSSDEIKRSVPSVDPSQAKSESKRTEFQRFYANYRRELADGGVARVTPFFGFNRTQINSQVGTVPQVLDVNTGLFGLRSEWQGPVTEHIVMSVGVDVEVMASTLSRVGSLTTPAREGDIRVFGQSPTNQKSADQWSTVVASLAPFAQADIVLGEKFHVIPGLRFEPTLVRASRIAPPEGDLPAIGTLKQAAPLEPRLAFRWDATERITAKAAFGIYHQPPFAEDMSAVFGNPMLMLSKAQHLLAGGNFKLSTALSTEVTGFFSSSEALVVRNPSAAPSQAEALIQTGKGRAFGTQVLLRHDKVGRFFGWVSASMIRSERLDPSTGQYRPFDYDQSYVLTALGSYDLGRGFDVGGRFRYSTGYPRTPVTGAVFDSGLDAFQPVFGSQNSIRVPPFYAFDIRASKNFRLAKNSSLEVYLDVQNVTNHKNPEEIIYNYGYSKRSYITGLPILPVLGGKLTW